MFSRSVHKGLEKKGIVKKTKTKTKKKQLELELGFCLVVGFFLSQIGTGELAVKELELGY